MPIEASGFVQQTRHATPLAQQSQSLRELHLVIEFGKANHIAAAAAAVTVEKILTGDPPESLACDPCRGHNPIHRPRLSRPAGLPIMGLQIVQQRNLLFQLVESLATHGLLASMRQNTAERAQIPGKDGG